jgi:hypothetical protein
MNLEEFRNSISQDCSPAGIGPALVGLWWEAKGDWAQAHESAQQDKSPAGSWVHASFHRKEGDLTNAGYWYRRAGKPVANRPSGEEWKQIADSLLKS